MVGEGLGFGVGVGFGFGFVIRFPEGLTIQHYTGNANASWPECQYCCMVPEGLFGFGAFGLWAWHV